MSDETKIQSGEVLAADQLLQMVYEELRKLAAAKLAQEKPAGEAGTDIATDRLGT